MDFVIDMSQKTGFQFELVSAATPEKRYTMAQTGEINLIAGMRKDEPGALIILDVDYFKNINDTYGHMEGDEVLKQVARLRITGLTGLYTRQNVLEGTGMQLGRTMK